MVFVNSFLWERGNNPIDGLSPYCRSNPLACPLTVVSGSRATWKLASLGDFRASTHRASLVAFERVEDAGEFTESSQYAGLMDSEALISKCSQIANLNSLIPKN